MRYLVIIGVVAASALADEGMWTYNNFPTEKVQAAYGFKVNQNFLDHLRLSSLRIANGCSASFVSPDGLVLTNHHCARRCIQNVAALQKKDYNRDGFYAQAAADEARCPGYELNQLIEITDVSKKMAEATRGVSDENFYAAQLRASAAIEKECATNEDVRCEVVPLHPGGEYNLYKYRRFQDVRLVMAPEDSIAFFGGDPDNFTFPRYDLDMTFLRIYGKDNKPLKPDHYFKLNTVPVKDGDLTFVTGNPGSTRRYLTSAQLDNDRDSRVQFLLVQLAEWRGMLREYGNRGADQKRQSSTELFSAENSYKAYNGRRGALLDPTFVGRLKSADASLRERVKANPELERLYGPAWENIRQILAKADAYRVEYAALEKDNRSVLYSMALKLQRYGDESAKPSGERLKEYSDARLPEIKAFILSKRAITNEFQIAVLTLWLEKMREYLGVDHPLIAKVFGKKSARDVATAAVSGSKLKDLTTDQYGNAIGGYRKELFDGGKAKIDESNDSMLAFVRLIDPAARAIRAKVEAEVEGPMRRQEELLSRAMAALGGVASRYPDATFSPRVSYGTVKGYEVGSKAIAPFTTMGGAFGRATGSDPLALPKTWLAAEQRIGKAVPFNMVTTNDIIGGNSGSPVVNTRGELVGLVFDGNIQSLPGDYAFDPAQNRAISVTVSSIMESLTKIYGADRLASELQTGNFN